MFTTRLFSKSYTALEQRDSSESLLPESEKSGLFITSQGQLWMPYYFITSLLFLFIATTTLGFWMGQKSQLGNLDSICTSHTSKYSPILDENIISYEVVEFDGRFMKNNEFRMDAGPEVDAAWNTLGGHYRPMLVPDELAAKSGLTRNHTRRNPKLGGGYPVYMEGLHHLHCLNLVRQSLYYNHDYYVKQGEGAFSDPPEIVKWHVSHCLDIIRQRLMCTIDTGVFGAIWVDRKHPHPFVDFNTNHICKNFEQVREFAKKHQIPAGDLPDGYYEMPSDIAGAYVFEYTP